MSNRFYAKTEFDVGALNFSFCAEFNVKAIDVAHHADGDVIGGNIIKKMAANSVLNCIRGNDLLSLGTMVNSFRDCLEPLHIYEWIGMYANNMASMKAMVDLVKHLYPQVKSKDIQELIVRHAVLSNQHIALDELVEWADELTFDDSNTSFIHFDILTHIVTRTVAYDAQRQRAAVTLVRRGCKSMPDYTLRRAMDLKMWQLIDSLLTHGVVEPLKVKSTFEKDLEKHAPKYLVKRMSGIMVASELNKE